MVWISILAVLADRDPKGKSLATIMRISILAVLADRDCLDTERTFLLIHFNPRGPCGPRHGGGSSQGYFKKISILAVLADRDPDILS